MKTILHLRVNEQEYEINVPAVGVRIDQAPITPDLVLKALEQKAKIGNPRSGPQKFPDVQYPAPIHVDPSGNAPRLLRNDLGHGEHNRASWMLLRSRSVR